MISVRYGEASGSGKDSHWKDHLLLTVPGAGWAGGLPRHVCPHGKHQRHSGGTEQGWEVDRDFTVVSAGRNSEAGPTELRMGQSEISQQARGIGDGFIVWPRPWGQREGRGQWP